MNNIPRPNYVWSKTDNGTIIFECDASTPPSSVKAWVAYTIDGNKRRDFRLVALMPPNNQPGLHPVLWMGFDMQPTSTTPSTISYEAWVAPPATGWVGFVIEVQWPTGIQGSTFRVSSAPSILPDTFPYDDCTGMACKGELL